MGISSLINHLFKDRGYSSLPPQRKLTHSVNSSNSFIWRVRRRKSTPPRSTAMSRSQRWRGLFYGREISRNLRVVINHYVYLLVSSTYVGTVVVSTNCRRSRLYGTTLSSSPSTLDLSISVGLGKTVSSISRNVCN